MIKNKSQEAKPADTGMFLGFFNYIKNAYECKSDMAFETIEGLVGRL
jgi:hypothetical protein